MPSLARSHAVGVFAQARQVRKVGQKENDNALFHTWTVEVLYFLIKEYFDHEIEDLNGTISEKSLSQVREVRSGRETVRF